MPTSLSSLAREDTGDYRIADALAEGKEKNILGEDIKFYFGKQGHRSAARKMGKFRSNKKANAFKKSDTAACNWVFLSAMKALRDRARREGGNAVINIKSNYKNHLTSSKTTFVCGAGNVMVGVSLTGDVVKLKIAVLLPHDAGAGQATFTSQAPVKIAFLAFPLHKIRIHKLWLNTYTQHLWNP